MLALAETLDFACLTVVITGGKLFEPLRRWYRPLFGCPLCLGVQIGVGGAVFYGHQYDVRALLSGAVVGCVATVIHHLLMWLETKAA